MDDTLALPISRRASRKCAAQHLGPWCIEPKWWKAAVDQIRAGTWKPQTAADEAPEEYDDEGEYDDESPRYVVRNGVAIITIDGQMTKRGSSFGGCSTVEVRRALRAARDAYDVEAILLHVCSPGGTVSGTADLATDVRETIDAGTPVYAYIADMGCSAAYWVASQAVRVWCNVTALVGSIGTYTVLEDDTGLQEQVGVKYRLVSSARYKGLGADGQVGDLLVADVQREVDELNAPFLAAVAAGRGDRIADVAAVADGRCHVGENARQLGLVDAVASLDDALAAISQEVGTMPITREQFDSYAAEHPEAVEKFIQQGRERAAADAKPKAATVQELDAAFPGQGDFVLAQLKAGATMEQANAAAAKALGEKLAAKDAEVADLKDKLAKAGQGTPPIPADTSTTPTGQVSDARKKELLGMTPLGQAVLAAK